MGTPAELFRFTVDDFLAFQFERAHTALYIQYIFMFFVGVTITHGCIPVLLHYSLTVFAALLLEDGDLACKS